LSAKELDNTTTQRLAGGRIRPRKRERADLNQQILIRQSEKRVQGWGERANAKAEEEEKIKEEAFLDKLRLGFRAGIEKEKESQILNRKEGPRIKGKRKA